MQKIVNKSYVSVAELAKLLGISRVAVFKRIKKGQIPAQKIGHAYVIPAEVINENISGSKLTILSEEKKKIIEKAVAKVVSEYGETLRLLGKE